MTLKTNVHEAARQGRVDQLEELLSAGSNNVIESRDEDERVPLHHACSAGHIKVVDWLLSHGAYVLVSGWTPLHIASSVGRADIVQRLLMAVASEEKPAWINALNDTKQTALHYAASKNRFDVIPLLLDEGANQTMRDGYGQTAMHRAATLGHLTSIRLLLEHLNDSDVSQVLFARDAQKQTPLYVKLILSYSLGSHAAAEGKHANVLAMLSARSKQVDANETLNILNETGVDPVLLSQVPVLLD